MESQKNKSCCLRSGNRGGQATGPSLSNNYCGKFRSKKFRLTMQKRRRLTSVLLEY